MLFVSRQRCRSIITRGRWSRGPARNHRGGLVVRNVTKFEVVGAGAALPGLIAIGCGDDDDNGGAGNPTATPGGNTPVPTATAANNTPVPTVTPGGSDTPTRTPGNGGDVSAEVQAFIGSAVGSIRELGMAGLGRWWRRRHRCRSRSWRLACRAGHSLSIVSRAREWLRSRPISICAARSLPELIPSLTAKSRWNRAVLASLLSDPASPPP